MDRDSFMDIVYEELKDDPDNTRANNIINAADEYVEDSQDKWIPCSLFMPKERDAGVLGKLGVSKRSDYVYVTIEINGERIVDRACTYDGNWAWSNRFGFPKHKIIAWQPYPEPYQGDLISV